MPTATPAPNDAALVARQYATDEHLQTRVRTHQRYSVGQNLENRVDALLGLRGAEALLDVGTGPGTFPARLHAAGHRGRLVGVDLSAGMVHRAQASSAGVEFVQAGADALPFPDASFDVLTARHMLYHVPSVPDALAEFRRVLKPGGRFLAVTNAAVYMNELWDAVREAAKTEPELEPVVGELTSFAGTFSERNGVAWVQEAFGNAQMTLSDDALLFPAPAPALAYLESIPSWLSLEGEQKVRGRAALLGALAHRFSDGPWRVSKPCVCIMAGR